MLSPKSCVLLCAITILLLIVYLYENSRKAFYPNSRRHQEPGLGSNIAASDLAGEITQYLITSSKSSVSDVTRNSRQLLDQSPFPPSADILQTLRFRGKEITRLSINNVHNTVSPLSNQSGNVTPSRRISTLQAGTRDVELIPNVVHYVWFGANRPFTFMCYLSFRSVHQFLSPDYVLFHGDAYPEDGYWWRRALQEVSKLYFVWTERPTRAPNGIDLLFVEHSTDLARIEILLEYGGIYLDNDVLILKSLDPLRHHHYVMGRVLPNQINSGLILSRRGAPFLSLWLESYRSYRGPSETYTEKATIVPNKLAELFPHLIHVEETSFMKPNWEQDGMRDLYLGHYDWSGNYAMHVWHRYVPLGANIPQRLDDIDRLNSTIGEVTRFIYYGHSNIRTKR